MDIHVFQDMRSPEKAKLDSWCCASWVSYIYYLTPATVQPSWAPDQQLLLSISLSLNPSSCSRVDLKFFLYTLPSALYLVNLFSYLHLYTMSNNSSLWDTMPFITVFRRCQLSRWPSWASRWLGYRETKRTEPENELVIYFWAFMGSFCTIAVLQAIFGYETYFEIRQVPSIVASFVSRSLTPFLLIMAHDI